ncbi:SRPBCC family protein [Candidatus Poriferisocius sp.]|uniref:SRPBCC family protein n=1 Tax=Candidatus Poriferisocius sp. TaxID=3101276 RepID=UPI003B0186A5
MSKRLFTASRVVPAAPEEIFALLADPARHAEIDGSGTLQRLIAGQGSMKLGSEFRIAMKANGIPYRVTNKVVEYEENRLIAWSHFVKNRWRYELEPVEGGTRVTESADYRDLRFPRLTMLLIKEELIEDSIATTLDNLVKRFSS